MLIFRRQAQHLVQNVILGFAFSVVGIRLFLALSPVTIVVVGNFHVAHMLYGGIFLFMACLLMLTFQNSRVLDLSSWLAGIGFGFFIDEIGKFVSLDNDYYYKLAAPLIYLSFLLTVFFLFFIRRRQQMTLTEKLHHALFDLQRILEKQLFIREFVSLKETLKEVIDGSKQPLHRDLAQHLYEFVHYKHTKLISRGDDSRFSLWNLSLRARARELLTRRQVRILVYVMFMLRTIWVIPSIILPLIGLSLDKNVANWRSPLISAGFISGNREFLPFVLTAGLEVIVAAGILFSLSLIILKRRGGFWLMRRLLLFSVLFLGLFNVYFGQFSALISIFLDAVFLLVVTKLQQLRAADSK